MSGRVPRLGVRLVLAVVAGLGVYSTFPPHGLWWAAVPGLAALTMSLAPWGGDRPRLRSGALLGLAFGLAFFLLLLPWVGLYVGAYAAWGLSLVESLYLVAFGSGAVAILRASVAPGRRPGLRALAGSVGLAAWWTACEWLRSSWPWGGFPWGRLAFGQADGPLLPLAGLVGATGLGMAVALLGVSLGTAILVAARTRPRTVVAPLSSAVAVVALAVLCASPVVRPGEAPPDAPGLRAAIVQGNVPRLGLDFNAQRRAVLDNHVRETLALADRVATGHEPRPDIVIWPENASDINPLRNADARALITDASVRIGAPILVGGVVSTGDGPAATNTMFVWDGDRGPVDRHDKRFVQPFGEWLPWRGFFEALFPIAKSAGHIVPGHDSGTVTMSGIPVGVATCYEIAFDAAAREPVRDGAWILTVPTNNATFGRSPMTYQQLGMSRVRAAEHHIPVLVSATSGVSAVVDDRGRVLQETGIFEPAVLVAEIPRAPTGTVATRLGGSVDLACCLVGLAALAWGLGATLRNRAVTQEDS